MKRGGGEILAPPPPPPLYKILGTDKICACIPNILTCTFGPPPETLAMYCMMYLAPTVFPAPLSPL